VRAANPSYVRYMNWPGPVEFAILIFLALFFDWIRAILCVAAAVLIRPRWTSLAVAALLGAAVSAAENGFDKFFVQFLDFDNDIFLALSALAGVVWWGIGRGLYAMWIIATRRNTA
jgi:hypothetical protein